MEVDNIKLINREISWLHFNERVLQEAIDETTPLIDRIKFLGIFSNNRDEFFRVRVATLRRLVNYDQSQGIVESKTKQTLEEISQIVEKQELIFTSTYEHIVHELKENNIFLLNEHQLSPQQGTFVRSYFAEHVRPILFPIMLDGLANISSLKDDTIHFVIDLRSSQNPQHHSCAVMSIPTNILSRFVLLPSSGPKIYLMLLDDLIRYCLEDIFAIFGYDRINAYTIKFTRDAELDIDNDVSKSFLEILSQSVKKRKKGDPVRFIYEKSLPENLKKKIFKQFGVSKYDNVRAGGRYHNFKDFMSFPKIGSKKLVYPPSPPLPHKDLPPNQSIIEVIRRKDIMLHYPYQSFDYIVDLLREASIDPLVRAIKMTFYRTAKDSNVMNALINAARNGKQVTVFMELQARFDEEANIYWTGRLQEEGVKIIQSIPGFKVHSKLILIRRKENNENIYYANISTGNYNESTARVYADDSLLTANQDITTEVNKVFHLFESKFIMPSFKTLVIAPFNLRDFLMEMLDKEINNARNGKQAWAILKMNSLVDKKAALKVYEASQAGVKMQLIIRGICVIVPGIPALSENIEAISIVDKFLEHSRVYVYCNGGDPKYYISSADWMQRNFDHRVETLCPIFDREIQQELMDMLQIQVRDNCKARLLGEHNLNQYRKTDSRLPHRAQFETYDYFEKKLKKEQKF